MDSAKQKLLLSITVVLLAATSLVTGGYRIVSDLMCYALIVVLIVGIAGVTGSVVRILKTKQRKSGEGRGLR